VNRSFMLVFVSVVLAGLAMPALVHAAGETPSAGEVSSGGLSQGIGIGGVGLGCGLIIVGAGWGIGKIGSSAVESIARQPEVSASISTAMLISAALIEGVTFFALIICMLAVFLQQ